MVVDSACECTHPIARCRFPLRVQTQKNSFVCFGRSNYPFARSAPSVWPEQIGNMFTFTVYLLRAWELLFFLLIFRLPALSHVAAFT